MNNILFGQKQLQKHDEFVSGWMLCYFSYLCGACDNRRRVSRDKPNLHLLSSES